MLRRIRKQCVVLVVFFAFCQVISTMCALHDLSVAEEIAWLAEETAGMTCPMGGTVVCPPSATSLPESQLKNGAVIRFDEGPFVLSPDAALPASSVEALCSGSSAYSIVPISIGSSSVLRI